MAKAKSTLNKVKAAVVDTAAAVVKAADAHVVQPVGQALGLADPPKAKAKPGRAKRAAAKRPARDATKPTLKQTAAASAKATKPARKGSAAATMSRGVKPTPKPKTAGGPPKRVSGQAAS